MEDILKQILSEIQSINSHLDKMNTRLDIIEEKMDHNHLELRNDIRNVYNKLSTQKDVISLLSERSIEHEAMIRKNR